jgi:hypothetical protein
MKSKFNLVIALLFFTAWAANAAEAEFSKQFRKGWSKNGVSGIQITNKFGEVKVNNSTGDSITVKVLITIDTASESKANNLLNRIRISLKKEGDQVIGETQIEEGFNGNNVSFSIDYLINTPKDKDLTIYNKYGNVVISELEAKGVFDVGYGSLTTGKLKSPTGVPVKVVVSYGKADIESINSAMIEIKYSKMNAGEISELRLDSKYSGLVIHKVGKLNVESKYDSFNLDEIGELSAISKYTNYKIGLLTENLILDTGYGSVRIDRVDPKFKEIRITNSYGGINIGLGSANYKINADCDYCNIDYPESRYKGNKIRESHSFSLEGNVGTGGGKVNISSRYGGIKLNE